MFSTLFLIYWLFLLLLASLKLPQTVGKLTAAAISILYVAAMLTLGGAISPVERLALGSVGLLFTIKAAVLIMLPPESRLKPVPRLLYMTIWPGLATENLQKQTDCNETGRAFIPGYISFWLGATIFAVTAAAPIPAAPIPAAPIPAVPIAAAPIAASASTWLGLLSILLMVHFGYAVMLSCLMRLFGWNVQYLFNRPELSDSLQDFWSKRWNIAFVEMNKIVFLPACKKILRNPKFAIVAVFLISGILHELAITYPAGAGFGGPLLYFAIQGIGMLAERKFVKRLPVTMRHTWALLVVLLPLGLLFPESFRNIFILPLFQQAHHLLTRVTPNQVLSTAIWCAAAGHFCTLLAGLQVPFRLNWKEDLAKLTRFNRKIMLNYAAYTGMTIVAFGCLTLQLHNEMLAGQRAAVSLSLFIAIFWIIRIVVDLFWFKHDDWPTGPEFVIGHTLLHTLFICLASVYSYIVILNWCLHGVL